jgi:alkylhydroperoxidase/carboxymuconolactone decarboxylase family protein YurZ
MEAINLIEKHKLFTKQWHIKQAKNEGATIQEVLEAVEVAIEMGIGPATVNARFALEVMEKNYGKIK